MGIRYTLTLGDRVDRIRCNVAQRFRVSVWPGNLYRGHDRGRTETDQGQRFKSSLLDYCYLNRSRKTEAALETRGASARGLSAGKCCNCGTNADRSRGQLPCR